MCVCVCMYIYISSLNYLHLDDGIFCRVRRLAWCSDPKCYAGGSVATGRVTLAGQVKESTQTKRDTLVLQVGSWVDGPAGHHSGRNTHARKPRQRFEKTDGLSNKGHKA